MRIGKFMLVGLNGLLINEVLLFVFTDVFGIYFLVSSVIAVELALLTNFVINEKWTFRDREKKESVWKRLGKYNVICVGGMLLNVALLYAFTVLFSLYYLISNLLAIGIVFYWNYFINLKFTWVYEESVKTFRVGMNPLVSIIIPTYNEKENIEMLVPGIFQALEKSGVRGEVVIVDDNSPDGTGEIAEKLKKDYRVKVIRRPGKMGLSTAVLDGIRNAEGEIIGVMDADMSHPPAIIPDVLRPLLSDEADISVGSRYVSGGKISGWHARRKIISRGAGLLARPLTKVKDPMSGFFFFKKEAIEGRKLNPTGYKIGLEILVKCEAKVAEVPYTFVDRKHGKSKLNLAEEIRYLKHLFRLYWYKINR